MKFVTSARGFLFDCDGTLVDSTAVVERHWREFACRRGLDITQILPSAHGQRSEDVIARLVAAAEVDEETTRFEEHEAGDTIDIRATPGAEVVCELPSMAWAIVTSGGRAVATARLAAAGLPVPRVLISADDVSRGKPEPEGYLQAASELCLHPVDCVVIEDTLPGVLAGKAAGCMVLAISTTRSADQLRGADLVLPDLTHIAVVPGGSGFRVYADPDGIHW